MTAPVGPSESETALSEERPLVIGEDMLAPPAEQDRRAEFEDGMGYAPRATLLLILVLVAVFVWQLAAGMLRSEQAIVASGALVRSRVLAGESWRLLSAGFLHGSPDHIIGNVVSLYVLGLATEHAYGTQRFLLVYLVALVAGSAASVLSNPGPSVGASGAVFGLMGAVMVVLHRYRDEIHVGDKRIGVVVGLWAGYTLLLGALSPMIDNAAHLGGLVGGALAATVWRPAALLERLHRPTA